MPALLSQSNKFMATGALILSVLAILLVVAMRTTPCANAQSGSCTVGATEVFASGITVNEDGNDADTRMEGDTEANLFYLDAGNDRIGLGTSSPSVFFDIQGITSFGDNNITNVADIAVDSISGDTDADTTITFPGSDFITIEVGGVTYQQFNQNLDSVLFGADGSTTAVIHRQYFHNFQIVGGTSGIMNDHRGALSGASGNTGNLIQQWFRGTVVTQAVEENISLITQVRIDEPAITDNLTDTGQITSAVSLYVSGASSAAVAGGNHAISMPSGAFNVSDGQGATGEQLTSGGQDGNVTWTAAASSREVKKDVVERTDYDNALAKMVAAPVYDFKYKPNATESYSDAGELKTRIDTNSRTASTGDYDTTYVGIMADEAPWAMHYDGTILNPISTFGYTVMSFKELASLINDLEAQITDLEARVSALESAK